MVLKLFIEVINFKDILYILLVICTIISTFFLLSVELNTNIQIDTIVYVFIIILVQIMKYRGEVRYKTYVS